MTSSSHKKRPITPPNTSTFGKRAGWLASIALLCVGAATLEAAPPKGVQPIQRSLRTLPTLNRSGTAYRSHPPANEQPQQLAQPARNSAATAPATGSQAKVAVPEVDSSSPAGYVPRTTAANYPPKAPPADAPRNAALAPSAGVDSLVRQVSADEADLEPVPTQQVNRRFKKINEILPHYDYSPDGTGKRCDNLCPRPAGVDCPDCPPAGTEYNAEACPECPEEKRLVDVDPHNSNVAAIGQRSFGQINYCWEPSNLYHLPIYFEDFALERYGHTRHHLVQPFFSTGLFATQLLGLPYQMTIDPVCKKRYVLGWHRPGACVPYRYYQIPWNTEAAIVQGAAVTGGYFLFAPAVSP